MKKERLNEIQNSINEKLGEETSALISDDLANLLVESENDNKKIKELETSFEKSKKDNEMLIKANGNLLQQIGMQDEEIINNEQNNQDADFNIQDAFDSKGNFK